MDIFQLINGHIASKYIKLFQMKIIIASCLFFLSISLFAQDTTQTVANNIYWKWPHYRMNGKRINAKQLSIELNKVPESSVYFKKASTNFTVGVLSVIPLTVSVLLIKQENNYNYRLGKNTPFYIGTTLSSALLIYSLIRNKNFMKKATRIYNEKRITTY